MIASNFDFLAACIFISRVFSVNQTIGGVSSEREQGGPHAGLHLSRQSLQKLAPVQLLSLKPHTRGQRQMPSIIRVLKHRTKLTLLLSSSTNDSAESSRAENISSLFMALSTLWLVVVLFRSVCSRARPLLGSKVKYGPRACAYISPLRAKPPF